MIASGFEPESESDDVLLRRTREGSSHALDELLRRYRGLAYQVAFRLLGNNADALDAVQDGFVKAIVNLPKFQERCSFKTWLLRVVRNAALDEGRRRSRRHTISLDGIGKTGQEEIEPWTLPAVDANLRAEESGQQLQAALAELSAPLRETFVLHADAGLSYREVAQVLGISIGTVMSRLFYARVRLRGLLQSMVNPT